MSSIRRVAVALCRLACMGVLLPAPPLACASGPAADDIAVRVEGDALVVTVPHVYGIGGTQVSLPRQGPKKVVMRFTGFPELESLKVNSARGELDCVLLRPEGTPPWRECRFDGAIIDALKRTPAGFELVIPPALLSAPGESADVRWVDQWR